MAKTWGELSQLPDFQSLSREEQEMARTIYFDKHIAPGVDPEVLGKARSLFDERTLAKPDESFLSGVGGSAIAGAKDLGARATSAWDTLMGNREAVVKTAAEQQQAEYDKPGSGRAFAAAIERNKKEAGDDSLYTGITNVGKAIIAHPTGALQKGVVEQLPNMAAVMGGGLAGAKAGAATGAAIGSFFGGVGAGPGAAIGGIAGGLLGMFAGNTAIELGDKALQKAADGDFTEQEQTAAIGEGLTKAGVVTAVDGATLGLSKLLLGAPGKAVEQSVVRVLERNGIDAADTAAVTAARANPKIAAEMLDAGQKAYASVVGRGKGAARLGAAGLAETAGEGVGEYGGELAATGKASITDAVLESLSSAPMSAGEILLAKKLDAPGRQTTGVVDATGVPITDRAAVDVYRQGVPPADPTGAPEDSTTPDAANVPPAKPTFAGLPPEQQQQALQNVAEGRPWDEGLAITEAAIIPQAETQGYPNTLPLPPSEAEIQRILNDRSRQAPASTGAERADGQTAVVPDSGMRLVHGSGNPNLTSDDIEIVRTTGQKQGKKGRTYGGLYGTSETDAAQAEGYAQMMGGQATLYDINVKPGTKVLHKAGDITRLSKTYIEELTNQGYGLVIGKDPRGRTEYAVIDKGAIHSLTPRGKSATSATITPQAPGVTTQAPAIPVVGPLSAAANAGQQAEAVGVPTMPQPSPEELAQQQADDAQAAQQQATAQAQQQVKDAAQQTKLQTDQFKLQQQQQAAAVQQAEQPRAAAQQAYQTALKNHQQQVSINAAEKKAGVPITQFDETALLEASKALAALNPKPTVDQETSDGLQTQTDAKVPGQIPGQTPNAAPVPAPAGEVALAATPAPAAERKPDPAPQNQVGTLQTVEVPLERLQLSRDVPQFKQGADDQGVVEPLGGKQYDRTGTAPIQVWERLNGQLEVISGRHRFDLARRTGEASIPAQIHREADGFDKLRAQSLDAILNIRDGQGKVIDYVDYFKTSNISPAEAQAAGLVARNPGKRSYAIAARGGETLIAQIRAGAVTDTAAEEIANAAPGDDALQAVALDQLNKGRSSAQAIATLHAVKALAAPKQGGEQVDLFGFDDSQMRAAERMGAIAARKQREISADIAAISGAAKNPALAKKYGVEVNDPESLKAAQARLKVEKDAWNTWATNPELVAQVRAEAGVQEAAPELTLQPESEADLQAKDAAAKAQQQAETQADAAAAAKQQADLEVDDFQLDSDNIDPNQGSLFSNKASEQPYVDAFNRAIDRLNARSSAGTPRPRVRLVTEKDLPAAGRPARRLAGAIAAGFGHRVIYVASADDKTTLNFDGSILPDDPTTVFLAADAEAPITRVAAHEVLHGLKRVAPDVYDNMIGGLRKLYDPQKVAEHTEERGYLGGLTERNEEEWAADFFSNTLHDPQALAKLALAMDMKKTGAGLEFLNNLKEFISRIIARLRGDPVIGQGFEGADAAVKELEQAREVVVKAIAEYARYRLTGKTLDKLDDAPLSLRTATATNPKLKKLAPLKRLDQLRATSQAAKAAKAVEPAFSNRRANQDYLAALQDGQDRIALRILQDALGVQDVDAGIDRGGAHSPSGPDSGAPLYDVARNAIYPEDVYSANGLRYYGTGEEAMDRAAYDLIKTYNAHPNKQVRIYRAVAKTDPGKILPGDWVTTVRAYAKDHGEGALNDDYKIVSKAVYARDIFTSGDSWLEWGYHPQAHKPQIPKGAGRFMPLDERVASLKEAATGPVFSNRAAGGEKDAISQFAESAMGRLLAGPEFKGREKLVRMPIDDFLALALKTKGDPTKAATVRGVTGKFNDLPFLQIRQEGEALTVTGHEGRHRASWFKERGFTHMPVVLRADNIRWSEQSNQKSFDYKEAWPTKIISENGQTFAFSMPRSEAEGPYATLRLGGTADAPRLVFSNRATVQEENLTKREFGAVVRQFTNSDGSKKDGWLKAPNGRPSNLDNRQWVQVRTPSFIKWFGPWQEYAERPGGVWNDEAGKVSKIVDENGEPQVVYHGSRKAGFTVLDPAEGDKHRSAMVFTAKTSETAATYAGTKDEAEMPAALASDEGPTQAAFEALGYEFGREEDEDRGTWWTVTDPEGNLIDSDNYDSLEEAVALAAEDYDKWGDAYNAVEDKPGIYALFLNIRDPYERDFGGANWDGQRLYDQFSIWDSEDQEYVDGSDIEPLTEGAARAKYDELGGDDVEYDDRPRYELQEAPELGEDTNTVAEEALSFGNDGAMIHNVVDDGGQGLRYYQAEPDTVMVFFKANQAKSATQNTGEFSTNNDDLRFSNRQTQTPAFKKWFADSKVVDKDGSPLVVYHGSPDGRFLKSSGVFMGAADRFGEQRGVGVFWFSKDRGTAASYADDRRAWDYQNAESEVLPAYLKLENPLIIDGAGQEWRDAQAIGKTTDVLEKAQADGHDGVVIKNVRDDYNNGPRTKATDTYAVFDSRQIKSAVGNRGSFDAANPDIRFSNRPTPPGQPAPPAETRRRKIQRFVQDKFNRWQVIQDWLKEHGVNLSDTADVVKAEERFHSRVANQIEDFRRDVLKPLQEKTHKSGFTNADIAQFLHAQMAEKRNIDVAAKNPRFPDGGSGMDTQEARTILAAAPPELKKLANEWRQITEDSLDMKVDSGLITPEMAKAFRLANPDYAPVRGGPEDQRLVGSGKGYKVRHKEQRALGHPVRPGGEWLIENILAERESTIMKAEKALLAKHVLQMAVEMQRPDLISVNEPQKRQVLKNNVSYLVTYRGSPVEAFTSLEAARVFRQMAGTQKGNKVLDFDIVRSSSPEVTLMASPMLADNELMAYVAGHEIRMQINDDLLARAYGNLGAEGLGAVLQAGRTLNTWLSKVYTGYNPEFIFVNVIRDFITGLANLTGEQGAMMAVRAAQRYPKSFKDLLKYAIDPAKATQSIKDYREDGGNTGAAYLDDMERIGGNLATEYAKLQGVVKNLRDRNVRGAAAAGIARPIQFMVAWIEKLNIAGENAMRLAIYQAMRDSGKGRAAAASAAKNTTVNFNRKGEMGLQLNAMWLFFNAAVQGTSAIAHSHFKGANKGQAWAFSGSVIGLSYLASLMAAGDDEEDDKYESVGEYERSRNLLIRTENGFAKIPVPYGYGFFHNLGRALADLQRTGEMGKLPWNLASGFIEEFTPFGSMVAGKGPDSQQALTFMGPTAWQIFAVPALNRTSFGTPLYPEKPWQKAEFARDQYWRGTGGTWADTLAGVLEQTGLDVSPESLKHLWRTATGGAGTAVTDTASMVALGAQGVVTEPKETPFLRKLYTVPGVQDARARYYESLEEARIAKETLKRYKDKGSFEEAETYQGKNAAMIAMADVGSKLAKRIEKRRDAYDAVRKDETLPIAEKRRQLREMEVEEIQIYNDYVRLFQERTRKAP